LGSGPGKLFPQGGADVFNLLKYFDETGLKGFFLSIIFADGI